MAAQAFLPGFAPVEADDPQPDPLTVARDDLRRVTAAWNAAQANWRETGDWEPIHRLQPEYFRLLKLVERLELGYTPWYH